MRAIVLLVLLGLALSITHKSALSQKVAGKSLASVETAQSNLGATLDSQAATSVLSKSLSQVREQLTSLSGTFKNLSQFI